MATPLEILDGKGNWDAKSKMSKRKEKMTKKETRRSRAGKSS